MNAPLKPIYRLQKERIPFIFLSYGRLDVKDGAFVLEDANGTRVQMPVAAFNVLFLEPGTSVTHAAFQLAAQCHTLICFVGEQACRTYSVGRPSDGNPTNLKVQVLAYADEARRLQVARKMFEIRFGEAIPARRSIEQLRGIEGVRVRESYKLLARQFGVDWKGRTYEQGEWDAADSVNRALSAANAVAVILACGYSPR
ncbi:MULTISPECIES: CRISPR-associated endonuclease Cas1 [unclassified Variovorax]|uniref:CRISPR-associated endonuclease Cas1 n=1 Tax=unclassified Variovorax TaxID=663243 RepID=UPI000838D2CC|nr:MULTISPECIES: CRISPR-associated endonuclease Cas1 [unclassified Variovorax]PNG50457.1 CRISPR-associated endonuclease Cas1 [Variovorax sp. B2]PNG51330.1 CRISPR-associated endonuclease Cas1 [Variovorax sp. B4]VTU43239.1 CRISPR-associated endonuclease Cas1 [Variovorax sp. PBL-H6]VTU43358.1 CRISPR-associated endonuclease Cas1 [Variovorax sp. SRS16]VTU43408.1 CRISPR-associated endonuclease Cas1 [Variovorax sp. PBL-E5]